MAGTKGRSGGKRAGAGAKPKNQRWGRQNRRGGLENFFGSAGSSTSTPNPQSGASTTTNATSNATTRTRSAPTTTNNSSATQNPTSTSSSSSGSTNNTSSTTTNGTAPRVQPSSSVPPPNINDFPNFDAVMESIDEETHNEIRKQVKGSVNLEAQIEAISKSAYGYYQKAYNNIEKKGQLWDHPPTYILPSHNHDLRDCWKSFFKMRVFNWIPEAMLGKDWKPTCPNCNRKCTKNGHGTPPRIVFDQHDNYFLNSPNKYECVPCKRLYKDMEDGDPEKKNYNFSATCDVVMDQIGDADPEVLELFPCYLTKKNAIDKKCMSLVIDCAVKGIGPSTMSESFKSWHELEWQKKQNMWGGHVVKRVEQPTLTQQPITNREDIEKCPGYFSKALGGCVPGGKWLVQMFCVIIQRSRKYYDSECLKRARLCKIIAIDASYKVPKWMMKWGKKHGIYICLHSGTNEYNEIIMQRFSTSDNHEELGSVLKDLSEMGLDPILCFSDDPTRDESLLKKHFPKLKTQSDELEIDEEIPANMTEMTTPKKIFYLHDIERTLHVLSLFRNDLENAIGDTTQTSVKLSLDAEWPMYVVSGSNSHTKRVPGNINIVQLGSNVVDYTIILELYNFKDSELNMFRIGQKMKAIFSLKVDALVGCRHLNDYKDLRKQYPAFDLPEPPTSIMDDVSFMAINRGIVSRGKGKSTLQALCKKENMYLKKPAHVRVGTCFDSRGTLSKEALTYCQLDVEAPLLLHGIYSGLPDLTMRISRSSRKGKVGDLVDIMPETSRAIHPIAQGVIKQIGGRWQTNNMKVKSNQVLVEVQKVFDPKGMIHYPCDANTTRKCSCRRLTHDRGISQNCDFYLYEQYGAPQFTVLELKSRLRYSDERTKYPACVYETESHRLQQTTQENQHDGAAVDYGAETTLDTTDIEDPEVSGVCDDDDDDDVLDDSSLGIPKEVIEYLDDDGYDDNSTDENCEEATPQQLRHVTDKDLNKKLDDIIAEADRMSEAEGNNEAEGVNNLPKHRTVLGDAFHFMDRAKLPMHHEYKALFFRCLRAAMFVMVKEDVDEVKKVLESKGESWDKTMAFNYTYIAKRVRRRVPPPAMLYNRMRAVFEFFKDKVDTKTNKVLFSESNKNKFENVLELVKSGYASDPPGMHLYLPKTDNRGRHLRDEDGLPLYRSLRGTSNLESLHQYLTTSFGHTVAGPFYSDSLLCILRHQYNWRQSRKNRLHFPQLYHYNGLLVDRINILYEQIYGYKKYVSWEASNDNTVTKSSYGIVPVDGSLTSTIKASDNDIQELKKNEMLQYLADRQNAQLPFLPIRGKNEQQLVHRKLNEAIANDESLSNHTLFENMAKDWNTHHLSVKDKIYPKMPCHFIKYVKEWQKNQDRRDAAVASGANKVADALEYVPNTGTMPNFEAVSLVETPNENIQPPSNITTTDSNGPTDDNAASNNLGTETANTDGLSMLCQVVEAAAPAPPPVEMQPIPATKKRTRTRTCQGTYNKKTKTGQHCPNPTTCAGMNGRVNCELRTGGDPSNKKPRTLVFTGKKKCSVCGLVGCNGVNKKSRCKNTPLRRNT